MLESLDGVEPQIKKVKFAPFEDNDIKVKDYDFSLLHNIKTNMTVELANTTMSLKEVLTLEQGHVIPLEKVAGEPVDIKLNGEAFAKGEVVIINEIFGIRITTLLKND